MSILLFWLERGGGWGLSPSTSPADHQKLNVIQKWAFYFVGWRGVADGVRVHRPARAITRSWKSSKNEHFICLDGERWQMGFEYINQPANHQKLNVIQKWAFYFFAWRTVADGVRVHQPAGQSSGFECNPKMSILFFWLEKGGGWGSSPSTSPANHRKLNIIQKWAFHFFGCRGVVNGVWVHQPALPIIRSWT